nr:hypothetical protein [uncultured Duganella sp.]
MRFQVPAVGLACATLLGACGGGGGEGGGAVQAISFPFPGGATLAIPPDIETVELKATASSGGPVTYASNTPSVCSVSGATLSLLKAGECSVTASQAGFKDYGPVSERQLFVIPKRPAMMVFRNPGAQPLDARPVELSATSRAARPVTFASSTPAVCTVSGNTMTKLANGLCTITGTQEGDDIYLTETLARNIPIGTEQAPALTFMSGFQDATTTREGGTVNGAAGTELNGWWCNGWCEQAASGDGASLNFIFAIKLTAPYQGSGIGGYYGLHVLAGGLKELSKTGITTSGVRIDAQAAMKFNLAQNAEWFGTANNTVNVDLVLGHYALKDGKDACNVSLRAKVKPGAAAATDYRVVLRDLAVAESCGLADLNVWNELQDYAIAEVAFNADSMNTTVSSTPADKPTYPTRITLTGPITFQ